MLNLLEQDVKDAFGEPPRQAVLLFALTELRLLARTVRHREHHQEGPGRRADRDATPRARRSALTGAPGTLRVIDEKTVYLRMPPSFMEPETLLMVLKNLMRQAYDRERNGEPAPEVKPEPVAPAPAKPRPAPARTRCPSRVAAAAPAGKAGQEGRDGTGEARVPARPRYPQRGRVPERPATAGGNRVSVRSGTEGITE